MSKGKDVVNVGGGDGEGLGGAGYAKRMGAQVHEPDATPAGIVAALGSGAALGIDLVVALLVGVALVVWAA